MADMSESIRVRLLLAKFVTDDEPTVVMAVDETIWEHWDAEEEALWRQRGVQMWGIDSSDVEWREVWASFAPDSLRAVYATPLVVGEVEQ